MKKKAKRKKEGKGKPRMEKRKRFSKKRREIDRCERIENEKKKKKGQQKTTPTGCERTQLPYANGYDFIINNNTPPIIKK